VYSRHNKKVKLVFALIDLLLICGAFFAAYQTRIALHFDTVFYYAFYFDARVGASLLVISLVCWVAIGYWFNIHDKLETNRSWAILQETARQCALSAICLVLAEYMLRLDLSRFFVLLFAVYAWILLSVFRLNAARLTGAFRQRFGTEHFVMIVGSGENARELGMELEQLASHGIRLKGFLGEEAGQVWLSQGYEQFPLSDLPDLLRRQVIDEIIFAVDSARLAKLGEVFLLCDEEGVRTRVVVDFFPHINSEISLDRLGAKPLLTFSAAPHDEIRLLLKRATDVLLAAVALVIVSPVMLLIALIIRLTSSGPAIFRQERCGLNGRRFILYKFRSMCDNAEELKASLSHLNHKSTAFKIPNDPRLTSIGRFLRKFSIDEWPQLWNVLKGDMALVGPRPPVPEEVAQYQPWQRRRLRMRPGLTCLWTLAGRDRLDFDSWMKLDMEYIDGWSLELDWKIILRTIPQVLSGSGAH
jgi:exopolysaccharide biosynthesis polyprenyl glycosylphosphotransferase